MRRGRRSRVRACRHQSVRGGPPTAGAARRHCFVRASDLFAGRHGHSVAVMEIDVVLPCLNEAGALPRLLSRMPSGYRPIVADNGSADGSPAVAADHGATVVRVPQRGYGAACHAGLDAARNDVVCFMDADGSLDSADLPIVSDLVRDGLADLALGRRRPQGAGAWPAYARLGNIVVTAALRRRSGVAVRDIGPMRAARRAALLALPISDRRFGYPLETVVRAAEAGWRVSERDVPYHPRTGRSKVTGTVGGTMRTVRDMRKVLAS